MKNNYINFKNLSGWVVFAITFVVFAMTTERSGSLWDVGEFIAGAYKLQVVHPPGAPLFLLVGRLFAIVGDLFSSNPSGIAFAVNLLSAVSTAFAATFTAWIAFRLGKMAWLGRDVEADQTQSLVLFFGGVVAGLCGGFATSVWFSAVEGEVYALSTFFTMLTLWSGVKWYSSPDDPDLDKWLMLAYFAIGVSIGVHLLSVLALPTLALLYYFKKTKKISFWGLVLATLGGLVSLIVIQKGVIVGLPIIWSKFELLLVNSFGLPVHSGLIPLLILLVAGFYFGLRYAWKKKNYILERALVALMLVIIGYSTILVVVVRAGAEPPINMNDPDNVFSLIPYINREQYGERPILKGPQFDAKPVDMKVEDRYGFVGDKYEITSQKLSYVYNDKDNVLFPRMSSSQPKDIPYYRNYWMKRKNGSPTSADNFNFLVRYQLGWMYGRYFMWNFVGRLNGTQGYLPWDWTDGHWVSGIPFLDKVVKLGYYDYSKDPMTVKQDENRNYYFYLPFIFGLIGLFWQMKKNKGEFLTLLSFFIITGIGIIVYSNQPPAEPRERDYVLVGSLFAFAIWIGLAVPAIYEIIKSKIGDKGGVFLSGGFVLVAPLVMLINNFDDHDRSKLHGARDYATNFLESCAPNAIIFTYGDNDTYPLWYAQEVEGLRPDVRVVNLSLIPVDWYINGLRRKVNESEAIKFTFDRDDFRGSKRNNLPYKEDSPRPLDQILNFAAEDHPTSTGNRQLESYLPTNKFYINVDTASQAIKNMITPSDKGQVVTRISGEIPFKQEYPYLNKGQMAVLDIISSNWQERPIYWAITAPKEQLYGLDKYFRIEGLGSRFVPVQGNNMVNLDQVYENVMTKFKWGGLDKYDQNVAPGFRGTVYAMQTMFRLSVNECIKNYRQASSEEEKLKYQNMGVDFINKFFEVFPDYNFPYDPSIMIYVNSLLDLDKTELALEPLNKLIDRYDEQLSFYSTLSNSALNAGFEGQKERWETTIPSLANFVVRTKDPDLLEKLHSRLGSYTDLSGFQINE
ncbi:glycosyltransferase family 117 protein [Membranihabitans marinus]|uniref:glycosyltransferase family 117 protein n=1 Tax=Membranihabitans marinus TaxID=1227546 RepID=UPI001F36B73D|nr:DUF2723 domain-containing protein [Membranihabitans marinus]